MYTALLSKAIHLTRNRLGDMVMAFLLHALVRLIALIPLAALFTPYGQVALLCPLLWFFLVMPLRVSMAEGLLAFVRGEKLFSYRVVNFNRYGSKLLMALRQLVKMLLAGALIIAALLYVVDMSARVDPFTFIRQLQQLGGGRFEVGLAAAAMIALALCLPIVVAMGLCCGDRFFFAKEAKPYKGFRKKYFKVGLLSFLLLLPSLACVAGAFFTFMPTFIYTLTRDTSGLVPALVLLAAAFCLYLPAFPVRKLLAPISVENETR